MALKGNLTDIHIADLIQLNCQSGARARLTAQRDDDELVVYFDAGEIVHAQVRDVRGEEAVYELLTWETGTFEMEPDVAPPDRTIQIPWSALVMEGMRRLDEGRRGQPEQSVGKESVPMATTQKRRSERLAEALYDLVSSSLDIEGVVVISLDGLVIAAELPSKMDQARVGAVAAGILNLSDRSVGQLARGDLQQTLIQGSDGNVIITHAGKNATFVVLTGQGVNLGMAFLEAREGAQAVAEILA